MRNPTRSLDREPGAILLLLEMLSLEGSLVTIDALECQKKIAERILAKGADYLLAGKKNQPSLYEAIEALFFAQNDKIFAARFSDHAEQTNKGHGRVEYRQCWVCQDLTF